MPRLIKPLPPLSEKYISRFLSKVDRSPGQGPHGDCWGWKAGLFTNGYGQFNVVVNGKETSLRSSRVAFFIATNKDPAPLLVLHSCDWPPCCNPAHLFTGTDADNMADMQEKGRYPQSKTVYPGESNHAHKLTEGDVKDMRSLRSLGMSYREIGRTFGVAKKTARVICLRMQWKHVV